MEAQLCGTVKESIPNYFFGMEFVMLVCLCFGAYDTPGSSAYVQHY